MAVHVLDEANRCLQCKKPMCREGCPIHTPIPDMIRSLREGHLEEAAYMLFDNNPMSLVCSLVCNHEISARDTAFWGGRGSRSTSAALKITFPTHILRELRLSASRETAARWL